MSNINASISSLISSKKERKQVDYQCVTEECGFKTNQKRLLFRHLEYNCEYFRSSKLNLKSSHQEHINLVKMRLNQDKVKFNKNSLVKIVFNQVKHPDKVISDLIEERKEYITTKYSEPKTQPSLNLKKQDISKARIFRAFTLLQTISFPENQIDIGSSVLKTGEFLIFTPKDPVRYLNGSSVSNSNSVTNKLSAKKIKFSLNNTDKDNVSSDNNTNDCSYLNNSGVKIKNEDDYFSNNSQSKCISKTLNLSNYGINNTSNIINSNCNNNYNNHNIVNTNDIYNYINYNNSTHSPSNSNNDTSLLSNSKSKDKLCLENYKKSESFPIIAQKTSKYQSANIMPYIRFNISSNNNEDLEENSSFKETSYKSKSSYGVNNINININKNTFSDYKSEKNDSKKSHFNINNKTYSSNYNGYSNHNGNSNRNNNSSNSNTNTNFLLHNFNPNQSFIILKTVDYSIKLIALNDISFSSNIIINNIINPNKKDNSTDSAKNNKENIKEEGKEKKSSSSSTNNNAIDLSSSDNNSSKNVKKQNANLSSAKKKSYNSFNNSNNSNNTNTHNINNNKTSLSNNKQTSTNNMQNNSFNNNYINSHIGDSNRNNNDSNASAFITSVFTPHSVNPNNSINSANNKSANANSINNNLNSSSINNNNSQSKNIIKTSTNNNLSTNYNTLNTSNYSISTKQNNSQYSQSTFSTLNNIAYNNPSNLNNINSINSNKNLYFIKQPELKVYSLEFHTSTITELNKHKIKNTYYLSSCSYDRYTVLWDMMRLTIYKKFFFGSWCLSCTVVNDKYNTLNEYVYICGGFKEGESVKAYNLETEEEDLSKRLIIPSNLTTLIINHMHDNILGTTSIIIGTDGGVLIYDSKSKELLALYKTKHLITGLKVSLNSRIRHIYFLEYGGIFRIMDPCNKKILKESKVGYTGLDLQFWDDNTYVICGDCEDCGFKLLYDGKNNLVNNFPNSHSKVVLSVSICDTSNYGRCLVTLGADNKIKIFAQLKSQ